MKIRVLLECIFVCAYLRFSASFNCEEPEDFNEKVAESIRWQREKKMFPVGLRIMNDRGELIELTAEEPDPRASGRRTIGGNIVLFKLFTKKDPTKAHLLTFDSDSSVKDLEDSPFNSKRRTYIVTHGWLSDGTSPSCTLIRDAYLMKKDANVIIVDWSSISIGSYLTAVAKVKSVAKKISQLIEFLMSNAGLRLRKTTLVGHSLGAHIVGIAGHLTNGTIGVIFGLDPADPMFTLATPGSRISKWDARHVQIIHTNAGFLGVENSIGDSDFYPGGGTDQMNCEYDFGGSCSHMRAYEYFAESINSKTGFYGKPCKSKMHFLNDKCPGDSYAKMGGNRVPSAIQGTFYLWTNAKPPYAVGVNNSRRSLQPNENPCPNCKYITPIGIEIISR